MPQFSKLHDIATCQKAGKFIHHSSQHPVNHILGKVREGMRLERVPKSGQAAGKTEIPMEQRLQMLQEFLKQNGGITRLEYSRLTGVPRLKAVDDLNAFIQEGKLRKRGAGRTVFYVL